MGQSKLIQVSLPIALWRLFKKSTYRRHSSTDSEGLRAAIRKAVEVDPAGRSQGSDTAVDRVAV